MTGPMSTWERAAAWCWDHLTLHRDVQNAIWNRWPAAAEALEALANRRDRERRVTR